MVARDNTVDGSRSCARSPLKDLSRKAAIATCSVIALVSVAGITQNELFAAPSVLKYVLTVLAPAMGVLLLTVRHPLRLLVVVTIVSIPFAGTKAVFGSLKVSPLAVTLLVAVVVAIFSGAPVRSISKVGAAGIAAAILLIGPMLLGKDSGAAVLVGTMILVAWVVSRVAQEGESGWSAIYAAIVVAALIQAVIAIYEYKTKHHLNLYGGAGGMQTESSYFGTAAGKAGEVHSTHRPTGTLYDPISLGNILAVSCPVLVALAARLRSALLKLLLCPAGVIIVLALALSFSRFSWIGAAVGVVVACTALPSRRQGALTFASVLAVLAVAASLATATAGRQLISRVESVQNPTHASNRFTARGDREREETWSDDVKIFLSHPIAGVGLGRIYLSLARYLPRVQEGTNGQNTYLQVAAEAGILGIVALFWIVAATAKALIGARRSPLIAGALGAGSAVLIVWLTDVTIRYTPVAAFFAILVGLAAAVASGVRYDSGSVRSQAAPLRVHMVTVGGLR